MGIKADMGLKAPTFPKITIGNLTHGAIAKPKKPKRKSSMDDLKLKLGEALALVAEADSMQEAFGVPSPGGQIGAAINKQGKKTPKRVSRLVPTEEAAKKVADILNKGAGKKVASYEERNGKWLVQAHGVRLSALMNAIVDAGTKAV